MINSVFLVTILFCKYKKNFMAKYKIKYIKQQTKVNIDIFEIMFNSVIINKQLSLLFFLVM